MLPDTSMSIPQQFNREACIFRSSNRTLEPKIPVKEEKMTPAEFLREYEQKTNTHRFEEVAPLIADNAIYWFSDGSFHGKDAIKQAVERTWAFIEDEQYTIEDIQWLAHDEHTAVCVYTFRWQGNVEGQRMQGAGRGTSLLVKVNDQWQVIHEHLSALPQ